MENSEQPHLCVEVNFGEAVISSVSFGKGGRAVALRSVGSVGRNPPCSPRDVRWCSACSLISQLVCFLLTWHLEERTNKKGVGGNFRGILTP